ncbi:uncharacterized protein LOC136073137 [Hydra vulgaris]|uniref:uncharacterized protein LOC136073137 n=1 Tax=Hydra vulgaris TaxID=6087 RepID=UPI0032E9E467
MLTLPHAMQSDSISCGVFCLKFAENFVNNKDLLQFFPTKEIDQYRIEVVEFLIDKGGDTSAISQTSTSRVIHQFCKFFIKHYSYLVKWYSSREEMVEVKRRYFDAWGVKGLLGLIDGTMVPIKGATGADEPAFICRKGYSAINCQFVVDPDGQFRDAVIKFPGSSHDAFVYSNSTLKQTLELDPASGFLFGDSGYGLSPVMITLFSPALNPEEILFNKIHSGFRGNIV